MRDNGNGGPVFTLCRDLGEIWDRVKDGLAASKLANVLFRLNQHRKHNLFFDGSLGYSSRHWPYEGLARNCGQIKPVFQ